jgi:hypothetical protein
MKTQAWGWLMAGVAALGMNGFYHDGGLACLHKVVNCVESRSAAVLALATGHVDQFLEQARMAATPDDSAPAQWDGQLAQVQYEVARSEDEFAHFQAISAREQAAVARIEAKRAQIEDRAAHRGCVRVPNVTVNPVVIRSVRVPNLNIPEVRVSAISVPEVVVPEISVPEISVPEINVRAVCPHVRVNIPRIPRIRIPSAPVVHVEPSDTGPV